MTDIHTHILPGMDDGAKDVEESIKLLYAEAREGVSTVVLTPHFYRKYEDAERFLLRRKASYERLCEGIEALAADEKKKLPDMLMGAEVAWWPGMSDMDELELMCIGDTSNFLLELPFAPWDTRVINDIYNIMGKFGITPIIAHIERYLSLQKRSALREIFALDIPIQLGCDAFLHVGKRGDALKLIKHGNAHVIASDCHNLTSRKPNMKAALDIVTKKLGSDATEYLRAVSQELTENTGDEED